MKKVVKKDCEMLAVLAQWGLDDAGQAPNPCKHSKPVKNVIAKVLFSFWTTGVFSIISIMPPVGDPRILHGEYAGDLYLHLQDVSINVQIVEMQTFQKNMAEQIHFLTLIASLRVFLRLSEPQLGRGLRKGIYRIWLIFPFRQINDRKSQSYLRFKHDPCSDESLDHCPGPITVEPNIQIGILFSKQWPIK